MYPFFRLTFHYVPIFTVIVYITVHPSHCNAHLSSKFLHPHHKLPFITMKQKESVEQTGYMNRNKVETKQPCVLSSLLLSEDQKLATKIGNKR
jgi:hypothetical protein